VYSLSTSEPCGVGSLNIWRRTDWDSSLLVVLLGVGCGEADPLGTPATIGQLYQSVATVGMKIGRGDQSTGRKRALVPLYGP
jgi:hypothetical protein